jgi:hypothetical protein
MVIARTGIVDTTYTGAEFGDQGENEESYRLGVLTTNWQEVVQTITASNATQYGMFRDSSLLHLQVIPAKSTRFGTGTLVWLDAVEVSAAPRALDQARTTEGS